MVRDSVRTTSGNSGSARETDDRKRLRNTTRSEIVFGSPSLPQGGWEGSSSQIKVLPFAHHTSLRLPRPDAPDETPEPPTSANVRMLPPSVCRPLFSRKCMEAKR